MDPRNDRPPTPPALYTPLVWAGGGLLLTLTVWFTGIVALFRGFGSLFY